MNTRLKTAQGIYLITPDQQDIGLLCAQIELLLQKPIAILQYRNKTIQATEQRKQALALLKLCQSANVPLIVNDNWQLAKEIGADGVHLGSDDAEPSWVREQLGDEILIGVSCYNSFERAQTMAKADIDYLAFGAMFSSSTKPNAHIAELSLLDKAKSLNKPIVAIGGISPDNTASVLDAGADYIALISGIFSANNPEQALTSYLNIFQRQAHEPRQ
jgi:thiamine-phosphate pyrophosphorylase